MHRPTDRLIALVTSALLAIVQLGAATPSEDARSLVPGGRVGTGTVELVSQIGGIGDLGQRRQAYLASGFVGQVSNQVPTSPVPAVQRTCPDRALAFDLAAEDADGDQVLFAITTQPQHGRLSGSGPLFTYTPDPGYTGPDTFVFHVHDGGDRSPSITAAIDVRLYQRSIRILVTPDPTGLYGAEIEASGASATYTPGVGAGFDSLSPCTDHVLVWLVGGST